MVVGSENSRCGQGEQRDEARPHSAVIDFERAQTKGSLGKRGRQRLQSMSDRIAWALNV